MKVCLVVFLSEGMLLAAKAEVTAHTFAAAIGAAEASHLLTAA